MPISAKATARATRPTTPIAVKALNTRGDISPVFEYFRNFLLSPR